MPWEIKSGAKQNCRICVALSVCVVCGSVRARSTKNSWRASEDSGAGRRWGLFWWRGSINIALPPPRLLVCLAAHSYTAARTQLVHCSVRAGGQASGDGTRALMAVSAQLQQRKLSFFSHSFPRRVRRRRGGAVCQEEPPGECTSLFRHHWRSLEGTPSAKKAAERRICGTLFLLYQICSSVY